MDKNKKKLFAGFLLAVSTLPLAGCDNYKINCPDNTTLLEDGEIVKCKHADGSWTPGHKFKISYGG